MSQDMHKLQSFARERSGASGGETDVSHVAVANAPTHAPESSALESVDEFGRVHLGAPAATTGAVGPDAFGYFTRADVVSDDAHERQSSAVSTSTAGDTFGGADVEVADEERTGSGEGHEAWGAQDVQASGHGSGRGRSESPPSCAHGVPFYSPPERLSLARLHSL